MVIALASAATNHLLAMVFHDAAGPIAGISIGEKDHQSASDEEQSSSCESRKIATIKMNGQLPINWLDSDCDPIDPSMRSLVSFCFKATPTGINDLNCHDRAVECCAR